MIETVVYEFMRSSLDVPVYMEIPKTNEAEQYVVIERVGLRVANHVYTASIAFQSYAGRMADAAALDETVRHTVEAMAELPDIGGVHLESNYNFTDTSTKQYRYQCIFGVTYVE
jgi:hypothetical protein